MPVGSAEREHRNLSATGRRDSIGKNEILPQARHSSRPLAGGQQNMLKHVLKHVLLLYGMAGRSTTPGPGAVKKPTLAMSPA